MALRIRLSRRSKDTYRIVVAERNTGRDGKAIEILGHYSPIRDELALKLERLEYWLEKGAKTTAAVAHLVRSYNKFKQLNTSRGGEQKTRDA